VAYTVALAPAADRQFRKLPALIRQQLKRHIDSLATAPRPAGTIKMHGEPDLYRIRVGDYRIVYYVWDQKHEVLVVKIGDRREVYR
jgi:mRNA interferase RelE/StbE